MSENEQRNKKPELSPDMIQRMPSHRKARVQGRPQRPVPSDRADRSREESVQRSHTSRVSMFEIKEVQTARDSSAPVSDADAPEAADIVKEDLPELETIDLTQTPDTKSPEDAGDLKPSESKEPSEKEEAASSPEETTETASSEKKPEKANTDKKSFQFKKFAKKNKWFVSAAALLLVIIILVIVLIIIPSQNRKRDSEHFMEQIRTQEIKENDVKAVDDFFSAYYTALASGNTTLIESMFDDPSKAHVTTEISSIVNQYDNFKIYVTPGIEENDIAAFVCNDIHFANIEATAPSVDSFYLHYNPDEAALKICSDMYTDPDILKFLNLVSYREPIRSVFSDTNDELNKVLAGDKDLNNLYILMQSMTDAAALQGTAEPVSEPASQTEE